MLKEFHLERCCPGRDWLQFRAFELLSPRPLTAFVIMGLEAGKVVRCLKVYENHTIFRPIIEGIQATYEDILSSAHLMYKKPSDCRNWS